MGFLDKVFKKKDISEYACEDFAKEFKKAMTKDDAVTAYKKILPQWQKKCPSDGNLGYALCTSLIFNDDETPKTIFMNMNDIYHVASQRKCVDESLKNWYVDFAYEVIRKYGQEHGLI